MKLISLLTILFLAACAQYDDGWAHCGQVVMNGRTCYTPQTHQVIQPMLR